MAHVLLMNTSVYMRLMPNIASASGYNMDMHLELYRQCSVEASLQILLCKISVLPPLPLVVMWPWSMKIRRTIFLLILSSHVLQDIALPFANVSRDHGNAT